MHVSVVKSYTSGNRGVLVASAEEEVVEEAEGEDAAEAAECLMRLLNTVICRKLQGTSHRSAK